MTHRGRRGRGAIGLLLVTLMTSYGLAAPAQAAMRAPVVDQQAWAAQLAAGITHAGTPQARSSALLALLRAVGLGVYNSHTGAVIVRGTERGVKDFYLFDFEVGVLANTLNQRQTWGTADLAAVLGAVGVRPAGGPVDPQVVRAVLRAGVQAAARRPTDPHSLIPLLVRALGLRHRPAYDMLTEAPDAALRLDALQVFLITADLLLPIVERWHAHPVVRGNVTLSPGHTAVATSPRGWALQALRQATASRGPCTDIKHVMETIGDATGKGDPALSRYTSWQMKGWKALVKAAAIKASEALALAIAKYEQFSDVIDPAAPLVNALHDMLMSYSVGVERLDSVLQAHEGPPGHKGAPPNAGKEIRFRIKVTMRDNLQADEELINCAGLLGLDIKFPPPGAMSGVVVLWERTHDLERYGTVTLAKGWQRFCPRVGFACSSTGPDGVATLVFRPKDETFPGMGIVSIEHGSVTGIALYQLSSGHIPGQIGQVLTPKYEAIGWDIGRHAPLGFMFAGLALHIDWDPKRCEKETRCFGRPVASGGCDDKDCDSVIKMHWDITLSGRVCGASPYLGYDMGENLETGLWNIKENVVETTTFTKHGPITRTAHYSYPWQIAAGSGLVSKGARDATGADHAVAGAPNPPAPQSTFFLSLEGGTAAAVLTTDPPPAQSSLHIVYKLILAQPSVYTPASQTATVSVAQDTSCPLPTLFSSAPTP